MNDRSHEERYWVRQLLAGDEEAAAVAWQEYGERLRQVANARISSRLQQRVGADDIVQSVFRTFFRRAQDGYFMLEDTESLWRLLCTITVNKIRTHARFHSRQKRGIDRERHLTAIDQQISVPRTAQAVPSAEEQAIFVDELETLLSTLGPEERNIVELKLQSLTNHEVANQIDCSERTVRRILKRVESRMLCELAKTSDAT